MAKVRTVTATNLSDISKTITFLYLDDNVCPVCSSSSDELTFTGYYSEQYHCTHFYVLKVCPRCGQMSLYRAFMTSFHINRLTEPYDLTSVYFHTDSSDEVVTKFSTKIENLSPDFINIFNQSEVAEKKGLNEICGMGYRKSLEFLVKDFLCKTNPENADAIKKENLSQSIKRINENRIKVLAERCAWIGNDETHYIKKHEDQDLNTLKLFITALVRYIEAELAFFDALEIQPK